MTSKKKVICSIVIISFLFVQLPTMALAKFYAAAQDSTQVTQNAPSFKTTAPEPIATGKTGGSKNKVLWGVLGAAALIGLIAAVVGGSSGGGGDKSNPPPDEEETGSVQVEW